MTTQSKPGSEAPGQVDFGRATTHVPKVPGYNYAWVLCIADQGHWPKTWEYTQWLRAKWCAFATHLGLMETERNHLESPHGHAFDRVRSHFKWDSAAMWLALYEWLAPQVTHGRAPADVLANVRDCIQQRPER